MAHSQQIKFCNSVKKKFPEFFHGKWVLDIGSLDINGNNQFLFTECGYIGIDLLPGKNVDIASKAHELLLPDACFDVIISTECFEHDPFYTQTITNIVRMLKPGGLFLFTCATTGRPEHGTRRTTPQDAPLILAFGEWGDYYKNLTEDDIRDTLSVEKTFSQFEFSCQYTTCDLYFWGIKDGVFCNRTDYSFLIQDSMRKQQLHHQKYLESRTIEIESLLSESHAMAETLDTQIQERDSQLKLLASELNTTVADLNNKILERDSQLESLKTERNALVSDLSRKILERDNQLELLTTEHSATLNDLNNAILARDDQLKSLATKHDTTVSDLSAKVLDLENKINLLMSSNETEKNILNAQITEQSTQLSRILTSKSWRLTHPLRRTRSSIDFFYQKFIFRAWNALRYVLRADFQGLRARYRAIKLNRSLVSPSMSISANSLRWGIMATPHTLFIAHLLASRIRAHGWQVQITSSEPPEFDLDLYIVVCPQMFQKLPPGEKRIAFQLEQSVSSRWFTEDYLATLENSLCVLDYSLTNIEYLVKRKIQYPHVFYLPIGASPEHQTSNQGTDKCYDVLFYGDFKSCPRRRLMLATIKKYFDVKICSEVFGHEMAAEIQRARVVINLHYYENALLEMPRIQECLSLGVPVVSEVSRDQNDYPELGASVFFFEEGNHDAMVSAIRQALTSPPSPEIISQSIERSSKRFNFMFDRFLVAMNLLSETTVDVTSLPLPSSVSRIALSMPETISRRRIFESNRPQDCAVFDGLRFRPGWIGCGLSYSTLARYAMAHDMGHIMIMEDDVLLPEDFEEKIHIVEKYLFNNKKSWDVFAGVIAALHASAKVVNVENVNGICFVTIDKMTSMVCNIYNRRALGILAAWNPKDHNDQTNTIDRYLENQARLRVVTTLPFLVSHREEVHSTLWGFQNDQYRDMISASEQALRKKVEEFLKTNRHDRNATSRV